MLAARGLKDSPLFTVNEVALNEDGLLAPRHVAEIRGWLAELGGDADARAAMVRQTLEGAVRSLTRRAHTVADAWLEQVDGGRTAPRRARTRRTTRRSAKVLEATADGTLLRGEVLVRWQEFVGTGELLKTLEAKVGWLRDRMVNAIKGKPQQAERVSVAVESSLETLILEHAEAAAERAEASWRTPGARAGAALRRRRGPRPGRRAGCAARPSAPYASGSRTCSRWSAPRAPTSAAPPASSPTA